MHRLFNEYLDLGRYKHPQWSTVKRMIISGVDNAKDYYAEYPINIPNDHILKRLLNSFSFEMSIRGEVLYRQLNERKDYIAAGLGMSSGVNLGGPFKNQFITENCYILSTNLDEIINQKHWKDLRAIRLFTHPLTNPAPVSPTAIRSRTDGEYTVVGIDIPILAYKYKYWYIEELGKEIPNVSLNSFISKHLIPDLLEDQYEIALRNRLFRINMGINTLPLRKSLPFIYIDHTKRIDSIYEDLLKELDGTKRSLFTLTRTIPMPFSENYLGAVPKELTGTSVYQYWLNTLVYVDWLFPWSTYGGEIDMEADRLYRRLQSAKRLYKSTGSKNRIKRHTLETFNHKLGMVYEKMPIK